MTETSAQHILEVRGLQAWYGQGQVLHDIGFDVRPGEVVTLLGRNGAGKSTTLKSIMGLMEKRRGSIRFEGTETIDMAPHRIARLGLAFCPEDRGIYASLTAGENLELPPIIRPGGMSTEQVLELFPGLRNRLTSPGTKLSGGEQQMLAIGRILRTGARVLLLDEPTEGLAPVVVKEIGVAIRRLKETGMTILMVEQNVRFAATVADTHFVVDRGRVVDRLDSRGLEENFDRVVGALGV